MVADIARLGALFLFAAIIPAWTAQAHLLDKLTQTQAVIISLVGGAGIGAAINAFSGGLWTVFAYGRPLREVIQRRPAAGLRADMAKHHPEILALASAITDDQSLSQELTTSYTFHGRAPGPLLEWARRRHARFRDALDSAFALLLGLAVSLPLFPDWTLTRLALTVVVMLGLAALVFGAFEQRRQAEAMELLWHRMGDPVDAVSLLGQR